MDGVGSGVIIMIAAVLWLAYLAPTWLRRREYLATERNALRLQQTLRIMAETAEVPELVHAEATARNAALHERTLRKEHQRQAALDRVEQKRLDDLARAEEQRLAAVARAEQSAAAREAARRLAATRPAVAADVAITSSASVRLRRSRRVTSLVLLAALAATALGGMQLAAAGAWALLAVGAAGVVGSTALLGQLAAVGRTRAALATTLRARPPVAVYDEPLISYSAPAVEEVQVSWTPVPLPKPLYLSRPVADRALDASLQAASDLRQAAADSEQALRRALAEPEVTPLRPAAAPSRFAAMGFVEEAPTGTTDIDAALRRRRASA